jgi:hypothetical protein
MSEIGAALRKTSTSMIALFYKVENTHKYGGESV